MHALSNLSTNLKRVFYVFSVSIFLASGFAVLLPETAFAATEGKWIDQVTIRIGTSNFVDDDPFDTGNDAFHFKGNKHGDDCFDDLRVNWFDENGTDADLQKYRITLEGKCEKDGGEVDVTLTNETARHVTAYQIDKDTIFMPVAPNRDNAALYNLAHTNYATTRNVTFKRLSKETEACKQPGYISQDNGIDKDLCTIFTRNRDIPAAGTSVWIEAKIPAVRHAYCPNVLDFNPALLIPFGGIVIDDVVDGIDRGCDINGMNIVFANDRKFTSPPEEAGYTINENVDSGDSNTAGTERPTCETSGGLTWIICPVINGLAILSDGIFNQFIRPLLHTKPIDTTNPSNPTFQVWVAMRNIANILLVVAMIVIVFGQSIGGGLVDAYTAKKVLPRILAAAIMINLSIYMAALAIDATNVIGGGIADLIYLPFRQAGQFQINITQGTGIIGTGGIVGLLGAGVIWSSAFGAMIGWLALFVLLPLVLAFLGALFTIIVRMGLIQFLVITAPIACVLYCLPNTEKYFKKWWDLFLKTLLVYPIIMIIFALADVMAVAIDMSGNQTGGITEQAGDFVKIVLLALPLFMIPYAFKMAGGAIGAVHGAITDRSKKGVEAIKGNANDPNSRRNKARARLGQDFARAAGKYTHSAEGRTNAKTMGGRTRLGRSIAKGFGTGLSKVYNPDLAISQANKQEAEESEQISAHGDDAYRFAAAGFQASRDYTIQDADGNKIEIKKGNYYDSKGREISKLQYNNAKRWQGRSMNEIGSNMEYTIRKAKTDAQKSMYGVAMAENARANKWGNYDLQSVHAQATYPHKQRGSHLWFSTPEINEKTGEVAWNQVMDDTEKGNKQFDEMATEHSKMFAAHQLSGIDDGTWRTYEVKQRQLEDKLEAGQYADMTDDTGKVTATAAQLRQQDVNRLGHIYEVIDGATYEQQMLGGQIQGDEGGGTKVTASGASPASQPVIQRTKENRRFDFAKGATPDGARTIVRKDNGATVGGTYTTGGNNTLDSVRRSS